ncbi:hypothetical protein ERJ75_001799900 [Trypanosoma vivax]|nr:hypothetical protein ERJ75_001799700 [Trypanosoma vivax]KAH8603657.1 hypothetical protein ERJ75_001799900 [Trypanosoma vivax]
MVREAQGDFGRGKDRNELLTVTPRQDPGAACTRVDWRRGTGRKRGACDAALGAPFRKMAAGSKGVLLCDSEEATEKDTATTYAAGVLGGDWEGKTNGQYLRRTSKGQRRWMQVPLREKKTPEWEKLETRGDTSRGNRHRDNNAACEDT